jgi:hypothetical protein
LQHLGAEIDIENGYVNARAPKGLIGGRYVFPKVSVGATHVTDDGGDAGQGPDRDRERRTASPRSPILPNA